MQLSKIRIALDGPSGAGKSTVARCVAERLGIVYVDTGALYRTCGLYAMENGVAKEDAAGIVALLSGLDIRLIYENGEQHVLLCGEDVGDRIRTPEASMYASAVSKLPEVRAFLLDLQRAIAAKGGVIMDGRDIGTVIMPDAELKVFMTASVEERARRRHRELCEKGSPISYDDVLRDIAARDKNDSERETAPLKPAPDAVQFVNDGCGVEESADYIIRLARERCAGSDEEK